MTCGQEMESALSRYVDGEISPKERAAVEEHLATCRACRDTLALFRKNESLLSNALAAEAFGNAVVESVSSALRKETAPPEAKPVDEGPMEWLRARPLIPMAAAAALMIALALGLLVTRSNRESALRERLDRLEATLRDQTLASAKQAEDYERFIRDITAREAIRDAGDGLALAYYEPDLHIVVKASFDPAVYSAFDVYRAEDAENPSFEKLNTARLKLPEYTDPSARRGTAYLYKFKGFTSAGEEKESHVISALLPATELSPEQSVRIRLKDVAVPRTMAEFVLERIVDGRAVAERFYVNVGETIGGPRDLPGIGRVDFSTGFVLDRVQNGVQALAVRYTAPMLDENGRQVMQKLVDGRVVPAMTQYESSVAPLRTSQRAVLRPAGSSPGSDEHSLWKGNLMRVRAAK